MQEKTNKRPALGRGLSALIPTGAAPAAPKTQKDVEADPSREYVLQLAVGDVEADPNQPRQTFDQEKLKELADSIKVHGIIQPLTVRKIGGRYRLVAGERRLRAAQMLGLKEVPARVRELTDQEAAEEALVENLQRSDLNPIEEAQGYQRLIEGFGLTQEMAAHRVGRERSTVTNALRLLGLPDEIRVSLAEGSLSAGHAKALLGLSDLELMKKAAADIAKGKLSVRAAEQLVKRLKDRAERPPEAQSDEDAEAPNAQVRSLIEQLQRALGTRVRIHDRSGKGKVELEFYSYNDLDRILARLLPDRR